MKKGLLIVFEGVDGCGKSTQLSRAKEYLESTLGPDMVIVSKEPGGTVLGNGVRELLFTSPGMTNMAHGVMDLLCLASHLQNWYEVVQPALRADKIVLCDRWWYSQLVYMNYRRVPYSIAQTYKHEKKGYADLLITLVGDIVQLHARANRDSPDRAHQSKKAWNNLDDLTNIQEMYKTFSAKHNDACAALIDTTDQSIDDVWLQLKPILVDKLVRTGYMQDDIQGGW